jgi:cell division transport system permease protein
MTVLIGMFLLGLFIALGTWVLSWTNSVKSDLQVRIYFEKEATAAEKKTVQERLIGNPLVKEFDYVSEARALEIMKEKQPELTENLTSNPLPASYEVYPNRGEDIGRLAAQFEPTPAGVDLVRYGKKESDRILQVAKIIGGIFLIGSFILLSASVILIANTIRLSIFSRRREVEVMKLVGASNWFVRGPFMLEGIICALVGSITAVILLLIAKEVALPPILGRIDEGPDDVSALSFPLIALILVAVSLAVGALGSGVTLRRFLRI